ncbi:hypothetical protein X797_003879 [Metarhizium robertsii]|uniref:Uncharacterized protein n=1 Tax=Metarhizium robertsii TaxID=568076 RepID=A0A0A1UXI8_9HYPO|nr:hypothetical protein X797_003879 [Metarhizium robertsii]
MAHDHVAYCKRLRHHVARQMYNLSCAPWPTSIASAPSGRIDTQPMTSIAASRRRHQTAVQTCIFGAHAHAQFCMPSTPWSTKTRTLCVIAVRVSVKLCTHFGRTKHARICVELFLDSLPTINTLSLLCISRLATHGSPPSSGFRPSSSQMPCCHAIPHLSISRLAAQSRSLASFPRNTDCISQIITSRAKSIDNDGFELVVFADCGSYPNIYMYLYCVNLLCLNEKLYDYRPAGIFGRRKPHGL